MHLSQYPGTSTVIIGYSLEDIKPPPVRSDAGLTSLDGIDRAVSTACRESIVSSCRAVETEGRVRLGVRDEGSELQPGWLTSQTMGSESGARAHALGASGARGG